jgi:hypothetical protein
MSLYARAGLDPREAKDLSPAPDDLRLFAHIENLVGEEARLLAEPLERRNQEHAARLKAIGEELDRIWQLLRERAERLGHREARRPGA